MTISADFISRHFRAAHAVIGMLVAYAVSPAIDASAADAVFSADGRTVYHLRSDGTAKLSRIDLATGERIAVDLSDKIGDHRIAALARDPRGKIMCASGTAIWRFDDELSIASGELIADLKDSIQNIRDIDCPPTTGNLLITAVAENENGKLIHRLLQLRSDEANAGGFTIKKVSIRRLERIDGIAFTANGALVFGHAGDLWFGRLNEEIIPQNSEDPKRAAELAKLPPYIRLTLEAFRWAPLATLETADGTPSQTGVQAVAVSGDQVYAHVSRLGGSGWGNVVRLPLPETAARINAPDAGKAELEFSRQLDLDVRLDTYRAALAGVSILGSNGRSAFLCASPDGKIVHFATNDGHFLTTIGQAQTRLEIKVGD